MSQLNDSDAKPERDDLRRRLAARLGRLVAREYLSRQSVPNRGSPPADSDRSHAKKGNPDPVDESIISKKPNDAEAG
jgi:hypothetical protein